LDSEPFSQLIFFFVLLLISAFFSGSETAFFSINKLLSQKLSDEKTASSRRVQSLLKYPRRLLVTILIGNTLVNVTAASIAAILVMNICEQVGLDRSVGIIINVGIVTFLILIFSEITPKVMAIKRPDAFAKIVSWPLLFIYYILLPLSFMLDRFTVLLTIIFSIKEPTSERLLEPEEIQTLLEIGEDQGALEQEEKEMLHSIFEFGDTSVREIMIPRTDVVCAPHDISVSELIQLIKNKGHTRIPIYRETIDQIQGIVNAKDLLPLISDTGTESEKSILELARHPIYVPESKKIDELLRLFQTERQHMAIVVDEYGGTSGIVTLEDIIEEIVGEIRDEYDKEPSLYRKIDENTFIVNAKIDIETLNGLIDVRIPESDEYESLGGFILEKKGSLPDEGETIQHHEFLITMDKVEKNRIVLVRIANEAGDVEEKNNT